MLRVPVVQDAATGDAPFALRTPIRVTRSPRPSTYFTLAQRLFGMPARLRGLLLPLWAFSSARSSAVIVT